MIRSLRDNGATVTGRARAAGLGADCARQESASGYRNHPQDGILRGRNPSTDLNAFSGAGDVGEGGSGIPQ